jgi:hypothetical protein
VRSTDPTRFCLAALATWRLAHLVAYEDGPGNAIASARARAGASLVGELMDCFYCLSLWAAAPFAPAVAGRRRDAPIVWLALSGAACLLQRTTSPREEGGWNVLWQEPAVGRGPDAPDAREPGWTHHTTASTGQPHDA